MRTVICRMSNRLFVGLPLCESPVTSVSTRFNLNLGRDPDWMDINIEHSLYVIKGAVIVRQFPAFLKPYVPCICLSEIPLPTCDRLAARLFMKTIESNKCGRKLLGPVIEERLSHLNEYGNQWANKPVGRPRSVPRFIFTVIFS